MRLDIIQGLKNLKLRLKQQKKAIEVVEFLSSNPHVISVIYPSKFSGLDNHNVAKYLKKGFVVLVRIKLSGAIEAGREFVET